MRNGTLLFQRPDETCAGENNGSIELSATAQFNYLVEVTSSNGFSKQLLMNNGQLSIDDRRRC